MTNREYLDSLSDKEYAAVVINCCGNEEKKCKDCVFYVDNKGDKFRKSRAKRICLLNGVEEDKIESWLSSDRKT